MNLWNQTKTYMLMAGLTALLVFVGGALAGNGGVVFALVVSALMNAGSYWFSDRIVLRMYRGREVRGPEAPELFAIVQRLAMRMDLPMPRVYVIPEAAPNAFATGRNPQNAAVAVTEGLVRLLERREMEGVIAHELAHIRNRDTLVMTIAAGMAGALSMIANMAAWGAMLGSGRGTDDGDSGPSPLAGILGILIAPLAASLVQMAISRSREFMADAAGADASGDPLALARALEKLEAWNRRGPVAVTPATAHMFIVSPLLGGGLTKLFRTHPRTEERVQRLEAMAAGRILA